MSFRLVHCYKATNPPIYSQMFYVLVDVYLRLGNTVEVFKDVPHGLLHRIHGNEENKLTYSEE